MSAPIGCFHGNKANKPHDDYEISFLMKMTLNDHDLGGSYDNCAIKPGKEQAFNYFYKKMS